MRLLLALAVMAVVSCKYWQDKEASDKDSSACSAQEGFTWNGSQCLEPPEGYLSQAACTALPGARWDETQNTCKRPQSLADCQAGASPTVWDGSACVEASSPANFFRLCNDPDTTPEIKHTITVMSRAFAPASCQESFDQLKGRQKLTYHGEALRDLTPLAGFTSLLEVDLWNNKISDITPLQSLGKLSTLNLGHNELASLDALATLSELKTLIISENYIQSVAALAKLNKLDYLDISFNQINDMTPLANRNFSRGYFAEGNPAFVEGSPASPAGERPTPP